MKKIDTAKPLTVSGKGLAGKKSFSRKINRQDNYSQIHHNCQALPTKNSNFTKLVGYVQDRQLTEAVELLEESGLGGDLALFFLSIAQEVKS